MRGIRSRDGIRRLIISIQNQLLITNTPHYNWSPEENQVSIFFIYFVVQPMYQ
ncbi:hypothetical protein HanRHA438_Chr02g0084471 [Helianthus annuus]|nr:hypothetical protein HanRHA438_Chr02g0084471 [Helianthus annuus]